MLRKKIGGQHLEPIKVTKTQANYQHLLLDMMSKLVTEQKESNRLLRKMAGETENTNSKVTIFSSPRKNMAESIVSSPLERMQSVDNLHIDFENFDRSSMHCQLNSPVQNKNPHSSTEQHSPLREPFFRDRSNEPCQSLPSELTTKIDNFQNILNRIEEKVNQNQTLASQGPQGLLQAVQQTPLSKEKPIIKRSSIVYKEVSTPAKEQNVLNKEGENQGFSIFSQQNPSKRKIDIRELDQITRLKDITRNALRRKTNASTKPIEYTEINNNVVIPEESTNSGNQKAKQSDQKKNYSILSELLPYSDRRQIKIKFCIEEIVNNYKARGQKITVAKVAEQWLGMVYRATASICWNMLSNSLLSFDQTKTLFTENIIFNFIDCMKTVKEMGHADLRQELVQTINLTSVNILDFLCTQYPQTKVEDPNIALRSQIPAIDNKGRAKFDLISRVSREKFLTFKKKKSRDYSSEIMRVINYMIDRSSEDFDQFNTLMSSLFGQVFLPIQKRGTTEKLEETNEDQVYFEKVKSYTKFLIGRKISKNTPKYAEPEIQNGVFFVKSPTILRIITKWVEELDQMVRKPEAEIKNASKQFKDHDGLPMHLYAQVKNAIYRKVKDGQAKFQQKIKAIKSQCYKMQVLLTMEKFTTDPTQIHLSEEQIGVGKYCTYLKSAISSYICSELNEVIDFLLEVPGTIDQTKIGTDQGFQEQTRKDLDSLNLINCKIFDLLRCKCISKQSQIVYLLKRLKDKSNDPNDPFKMFRVKDRLSSGTRDILINAQIGNGLPCEIQLAVTSNMDKKQELLDQYNHFLYELKRAKLGAITENASIWSALEQRATFFDAQIKKDIISSKGQLPHQCITNFSKSQTCSVSKFLRPIICASCSNFFQIPKTCLDNIKCDKCSQTYCGECHFNHLNQEDRKQFIFEKPFFKGLTAFLQQYSDLSKPLPSSGFLMRKKYLKKQLFYYRTITKKSQNMDSSADEINVELITSVIENNQISNKILNKSIIEATEINGEIILKESAYKQFDDYLIYGIIAPKNRNMEKVTIKYRQLLENFNKSKQKYVNIMKQPAYIDDLRLIKKSKHSIREMGSYKGILEDDTQITYIRVHRTIFILQVHVQQQILHQQLRKVINLNRLKSYAIDKVNSVSMEFRGVTDQMNLIKVKFPPYLLQSFSTRLTKLYLNFGSVTHLNFLNFLPNIKILFIRNNLITSLEGVQNLKQLLLICFDNNSISSLQPLSELTQLVQISAASNSLQSLNGIQKLSKLKKLNFYDNKIKKMQYMQELQVLKELTLSNNPIETIENIYHLTDLQELHIGKTKIRNIQGLSCFPALKKLSLDYLELTSIGPIFKSFDFLVKLNLSGNLIEAIENLDEMSDLAELNLKNNKIKEIDGLFNKDKLEIIKLSNNLITDICGIRQLDNLKMLKLEDNPLQQCTDLNFMNRKQLVITFSKAGQASKEALQPTAAFYEEYNRNILSKNSSSGSNSSSDSS